MAYKDTPITFHIESREILVSLNDALFDHLLFGALDAGNYFPGGSVINFYRIVGAEGGCSLLG